MVIMMMMLMMMMVMVMIMNLPTNACCDNLPWTPISGKTLMDQSKVLEDKFFALKRLLDNYNQDYVGVWVCYQSWTETYTYCRFQSFYVWYPWQSHCLHVWPSRIHWHRKDPEFCDLDELPEVLAAACSARDTYAESAAIATQLTKPKGGKKKKAGTTHGTCPYMW